MRLKIRRAFYVLSLLNLCIFLCYLYGLASRTPYEANILANIVTTTLKITPNNTNYKPLNGLEFRTETLLQSPCKSLKVPQSIPEMQKFQTVDGSEDMYVFSAFYDDIAPQRVVRIIGLDVKAKRSFICQLWTEVDTVMYLEEVDATTTMLPEDHGRRFHSICVICPVISNIRPSFVSVTRQPCQTPTNYLRVIHHSKQTSNFTVCVTPFNFKYSRAYELVEMIELNRIMGANLFMFYNHSTGTNVDAVLRHYIAEGVVEVVQWHIPVGIGVDTWPPTHNVQVHYFGQLAMLNDCLFRNLHRSKYVVATDLDEFIVPKKFLTWNELLESRMQKQKRSGVFIVRCVFFRKDWPAYSNNFVGRIEAEKYKSIVLMTVLKEETVQQAGQRSKYIFMPERIDKLGVHNVWSLRSGYDKDFVSDSDALLHHYRDWEQPTDRKKHVQDLDIHRFSKQLSQRLKDVWSVLKNIPLDIPLSNYTKPV